MLPAADALVATVPLINVAVRINEVAAARAPVSVFFCIVFLSMTKTAYKKDMHFLGRTHIFDFHTLFDTNAEKFS